MQETPIDAIAETRGIESKENLMFQRFLKNPLETHLALKIKIIDDQLAKCNELMEREQGAKPQNLIQEDSMEKQLSLIGYWLGLIAQPFPIQVSCTAPRCRLDDAACSFR